jgi:hypothetical protein
LVLAVTVRARAKRRDDNLVVITMVMYEPGTLLERGYMAGISSVCKDDSIEDSAVLAAIAMKGTVIGGIEVSRQDAKFEVDDEFI